MEQLNGFNLLTLFITICILNCLSPFVVGFKLIAPKNQQSYARFPKWNACTNATLSFDFKSKAENGTVMYTDDHGKFDFFDMRLVNGKAKLRLNIVDGKDGSVEFEVGNNLNDYKWHTVKIERNRMETTFSVDQESMRKLSYGSDFYFGSLENNSDVFFGGLPNYYMKNLKDLALPSVMFLPKPRLEIRNVIYGNCSCKSVRGRMIEGVSLDKRYTEACDQRNPCGDCLCISTDSGPKCQCDDSNRCTAESTGTFYHLPMNAVVGTTAVNPSGLDATVYGKPTIVRGAVGNALQMDGKQQYLQVTGPGHRYECFGDLDRCKDGYTLGFWVKFSNTGNAKGVYLSNGGHSAESHGVAMMYKKGELEFAFRKRDGKYWNVKDNNMLEDKWYHVMVSWKNDDGLYLYVNGILTDEDSTPEQRASLSREPKYNLFYVGRANDKTGIDQLGTVTIDDFKFWSEFKDRYSIIEDGPMYKYHLDMDEMEGNEMVSSNAITEVIGNVRLVPGKIKNAARFSKDGGNIAIGEMSDTCLVEPALCVYGFTISFWLKLLEFGRYSYLFSSKGINIYAIDNTLHTDVSAGNKKWSDNFYGLETNKWHFVEVTWNPEKGVSMFLDLRLASRQKGHTIENQADNKDDKFYIGRANMAPTQQFPNAIIDEVEMWYGERESLLFLDLIQRGKPNKFQFGLDKKVGDRLYHPALLIDTYNRPKIIPGKIGNAIKLNGEKQYVDFGEHGKQCLGNLDLCHHGALTAFWFNPTNFKNDMYFFSSGENGITVKNQGKSLKVTAATTTQEWDITTDILQPDQWYFLEISFDPEKGLILYVNNNAVAKDNNPVGRRNTAKPSLLSQSTENKFYLGRGNTYMEDGDYGEATFDELEYWYGPRDYLIAFDYLQRGKPESLIIDMEEQKGSRILNKYLDIRAYGGPSLVQGVVGNALYLDGNNQYIDLGNLRDQCIGNLQECSNGVTISTWLNFKEFLDNMYILSTGNNGIRLYQKGGEIIAVVHQNGKEWEVKVPRFDTDTWNYLELSWHPDFGLNVYVNNTLVGHSSFKNVPPVAPIRNSRVYIGRSNTGDSSTRTRTAKMTVDETEVWYGRREELLAFDYILRDNIEHVTFSMEQASSGVILHPNFRITLANGAKLAPGRIGNAVLLDGFGQYVDLGYHGDICMGNLEKCPNGLTISLWFKARELEDNTYILSGPSYSLSYKDKKLVARFHANGKMWEVSSPNIYADRWHNIIMTWDPTKGLGLFIDGKQSGSTSTWSSFQGDDPSTKSVFIGRSNDDSSKTIKGLVDEVQFFYGPVDPLLSSGQLSGYVNHQSLPFDKVIRYENGNYKIVLPTRTVLLHGGVTTAPGLHSSAIRVNGKSQYLDLGDDLICGGNLDKCDSRGFTVQLSIRPESLFENMYFLDSFPLSVYYRNGRLFATARTPAKSWTVSWPEFAKNKWQLVELTWQPERGLTMYVNGDEKSHQTIGTPQNEIRNWSRKTYLGRSLNDMVIERYADATIERMDVWNAHKDYLTIHGLQESMNNVSIVETVSVPERPKPNIGHDITVFNITGTRPKPGSDVTWINIDGQGHGVNRRPIVESRPYKDVDIMVIKNLTGHVDALNKTQFCKDWRGREIPHGVIYEPRGNDPCHKCICQNGAHVNCFTVPCRPPSCPKYMKVQGTCCEYKCEQEVHHVVNHTIQHRDREHCKDSRGREIPHGVIYEPRGSDPCNKCTCHNGAPVKCTTEACRLPSCPKFTKVHGTCCEYNCEQDIHHIVVNQTIEHHTREHCKDWRGREIPHGEIYEPRGSDPCHKCICQNGVHISCFTVPCRPPSCPKYTKVQGTCCEYKCEQEVHHVVVNHTIQHHDRERCKDWRGREIPHGVIYEPRGNDPCHKCTCHNGAPVNCLTEACRLPSCQKFTKIHGTCCEYKCEQDVHHIVVNQTIEHHTREHCKDWRGREIPHGEIYEPRGSDPCHKCTCQNGAHINCFTVPCRPPSCPKYTKVQGTCCEYRCAQEVHHVVVNHTIQHYDREHCKDWRGREIPHGVIYEPRGSDPCNKCTCHNGAPVKCTTETCRPPSCPKFTKVHGTCCKYNCEQDIHHIVVNQTIQHHTRESCKDWRGRIIPHGVVYEPRSNDPCHKCTCRNGTTVNCYTVPCQPPSCPKYIKVHESCCEYNCVQDVEHIFFNHTIHHDEENCENWKGEVVSEGQTFEPRKDNPCHRCLCTLGQIGECYLASCQTPTCRNYTIIAGTCCQYRCHDKDNRQSHNNGNREINNNDNRESNHYNLTWTITNKDDGGRGTTQRSIIDERTVSYRTQRIETNIIRFAGDAYIHYDIAHFGSQQPRMLEQVSNETFYFQFITKEANGLIWMDNRPDVEMFLAIKNGYLTFAIKEGNGAFREVRLQAQGIRDLNDWRWHMFKIERNGRVMRFFLDDVYAGQITTQREVQLVAPGNIYLGGSPDNQGLTARFIDHSFDGAITEVIYTKYASQYRITIVSLLAHINLGTQHGKIIIYRPGEFDSRPQHTSTHAPITPRPTFPTTHRPPPKRVLVFRTVSINQYKAQFYISGNLDLRQGGQINFRFRTLHSDGLLFFSGRKGAGNSIPAFISFEIIDKILYFVYDFGSGTKRVAISNEIVSTGAWHNIRMDFTSRQLVIYLDNRPIRIDMAVGHLRTLYLNDGLRFGDISDQGVSWYIWARDGYIGCIADFEMINVLTNIPNLVTFPSFPGVSNQCVDVTRYCDSASVCGTGSCLYRHDNQYFCYCAGTGFAGRNCDEWPVTGVFEGNNHITYNYATYQTSHSNDISVRFQTSKPNTFLFQTYSTRGYDEFIRGELHNGQIRVTVRLNGQNQVFYVGENLNDQEWHTFNLRRRGNSLEMWIDNLTHKKETLQGNNFLLHYDKIYFGSMGDLSVSGIHPNFVGYMHNVYFDRMDIFNLLKTYTGGKYPHWILTQKDFHTYMLRPVTFTSRDSHIQMSTLSIKDNLHIMFNFKTSQPDGIILFNKGQGDKFIAIELINGYLYFKFNNGIGKDSVTKLQTNTLNDNKWHTFEVKEVLRGLQRQYQLKVDDVPVRNVAIVGNSKLDLVGSLYIGGLSLAMLNDRFVQKVMSSNHGFMGCMASIQMNGNSVDIVPYASQSQFIREGCVDVAACPLNACQHGGICLPGVPSYSCNCHMTAFWGTDCSLYPNGAYFGRQEPDNGGLISYVLDILQNSNKDEIALGFMTYYSDGILYRMESGRANEYIEIRLEDGFLVAEYDTGNGVEYARLDTVRYDDGGYHVLKFIRTGEEAILTVDGLTTTNSHKGIHSMFDQIQYIYIGGYTGSSGQGIMNKFNGIIGGVYWNGRRFIDIAHNPKDDKHIEINGDVFLITEKEYILYKPVKPVRPPPVPLPPVHGPYQVPPHIGGGGVVGPGLSGEGGTGPGLTGVGGGDKGISSGGGGFVGVGGGPGPITAAQGSGGPPPIPPPAGGGGVRAGALMGTILGTMAFLASVMWAFWQCKPGMITCPGGGGGGGAPPPTISPPTATNLPVAQALGGVGGGGGAGSGSAKITVVNGSASGGGAGGGSGGGIGGGSSMVSNYQSSTQQFTTVGGGGGGGGGSSGFSAGGYGSNLSEVDSSTLRATGTFSNKGTSIGTPKATRSFFGSASAAAGGAGGAGGGGNTSYMYQSETTTYRGGGGGGMGGTGTLGYGESTTADYDMAVPSANYQSNTLSSSVGGSSGYGGGGGTMSKGGYSTMSSSYNYQVQNMRTMMANQGTYQMTSYSNTSSGAVTPGAAGDEVRVDCCLMAADGRSVVTGSSLGPPQVWDMQTGELLRIMKGDTIGSTNLHLAGNDRLLVGAVHADLEVNEYSTRKGVTNKKLQIWDYTTGRPLEMGTEETCSALCVMTGDPDKVVFGHSEKFGNATSIVVWDLLGNQPLKEMKYDGPIGNNDYINFIKLSQNDRYCVAGFTNTFDNYAEFMVFDMNLTNVNVNDPCLLRLDANPECTVILPRDEAVTGLRNGDLVVWSLRTGQPSRQLLSGSGVHAHSQEVKAIVLSEDNRYLVSASADGKLKVWDMQSERQINTLSGHSDEVWCVAISPDNEIIVSGSRDGTIRLWRMKNGTEICTFTTGVDVFYVTMSHDKGTIVALGDKFGARKLIMLQVVRTKIRRQISS